MRRLLRLTAWLGLALILGLVFMLYLRPDFVLGMADQLWACF